MKNTFLHTVASAYFRKYTDLSRFVFVMPNKRSCTFLLKEFAELSEKASIAPLALTIADFVASAADSVVDSRVDLLVRLFLSYKRFAGRKNALSFDRFCMAGDTMLSDFNEVDMQMVDADEIFTNVFDLNSIRSNFLTDEQRKVMVDYFGYSPAFLELEFKRFWQDFESANTAGEGLRDQFYSIWQLLAPIYNDFKEGLRADGLTTPGGAYRDVARKISEGEEPFPGQKIVFVGFNALSQSEAVIFKGLKGMRIAALSALETGYEEPKADFIWDMAPRIFAEEDMPALKFVSVNTRKENFPMPNWIAGAMEKAMPLKAPEIKVVSVPSNVMQAKVAGEELRALMNPEGLEGERLEDFRKRIAEEVKDARVAVVLPDENLLLPMLHSLPDGFTHPNLTMGFPLRQTPAVSFVSLLRKMRLGAVAHGEEMIMRFEDVKDFLAHPYSRMLFGRKEISDFIKRYESKRRIMVPGRYLCQLGPNGEAVFRVPSEQGSPLDSIDYLLNVLSLVREAFGPGSYLRAHVEKVYIGAYSDGLIRLRNCLKEYDLKMEARDIFRLADRVIGGESVVFEGRPLEGLQIMGVLETRCLDFDRVIMLSVNEKVMPRVARMSTFIPNVIRSAFGMPPANYQEEIFAYYFFRLIGRCGEVTLTYDSRSSENRTPGPSRYLLQMKYLNKDLIISNIEAVFELPRPLAGAISIEKEGEILENLNKYIISLDGKPFIDGRPASDDIKAKNFSASALTRYFACQMKFLFGNVLGVKEEKEKLETIDAADMGTIVHRIIERLYFPKDKRSRILERPLLATRDFLKGLLEEQAAPGRETRIGRETRLAILEVHFGIDEEQREKGRLYGSARIIADYIQTYVRNIIRADLERAPFRLWGSEISRSLDFGVPGPGGRPAVVRLKMIIDRLDQEGAEGIHEPFRIVDYKTGDPHLHAENLAEIFDGNYKSSNIFQLLLYAELLILLVKKGGVKLPGGISAEEFETGLQTVIYNVPKLPGSKGMMYPVIGKTPAEKNKFKDRIVSNMGELRKIEREEGVKVLERLREILSEILNPALPFAAEPSEKSCGICDFRLRCEVLRAKLEKKS